MIQSSDCIATTKEQWAKADACLERVNGRRYSTKKWVTKALDAAIDKSQKHGKYNSYTWSNEQTMIAKHSAENSPTCAPKLNTL